MNFNRLFARVAFVAVLGGVATVPAQVLGGNVTGGIGGTISGGLGGIDGMARGGARGSIGADVDAIGKARRTVDNTAQRTRTTADAAVSTSTQAAAEAAAQSKARSESAAQSSTSVLGSTDAVGSIDVVGAADAASSTGVQSDVQRPSEGGPQASVMGEATLDASADARHAQPEQPAKSNNVSAAAAGEQRSTASAHSNRNEP
jgi:hypothetical protein